MAYLHQERGRSGLTFQTHMLCAEMISPMLQQKICHMELAPVNEMQLFSLSLCWNMISYAFKYNVSYLLFTVTWSLSKHEQ